MQGTSESTWRVELVERRTTSGTAASFVFGTSGTAGREGWYAEVVGHGQRLHASLLDGNCD